MGEYPRERAPMAEQTTVAVRTPRPRRHLGWIAASLTALTCQSSSTAPDYTVVRQFPHDTAAYTQGLLYSDGLLYESTGRLDDSQVRRVDPETGNVLASTDLPADRFGEGLALLRERLYQLTWKSRTGYVYDVESLAVVDSFSYTGEGWGLTTDGSHLIMSDGTAMLRFLDPQTFDVVREVEVTDDGLPLRQINELELVGESLYANIYQSDKIVRIDPTSGDVLDWYDLAGLLPNDLRTATDVLNGIAYREDTGNLLLTGKLWPVVFEVSLRSDR
jgi:glutaminyl-peptide cyclotransferase